MWCLQTLQLVQSFARKDKISYILLINIQENCVLLRSTIVFFDKELLAIVQDLKHWWRNFEGAKHPVIIHTDHKNLEYSKGLQILNQRQARWSIDLLLFDFEIKCIPGLPNTLPDLLSRRLDYQTNEIKISAQNILPSISFANMCSLIKNPFDAKFCKDTRASKKYQS